VLAYRRAHPRSAPFLSLTNFSDVTQSADAGILARAGLHQPVLVHSTTGPASPGPTGPPSPGPTGPASPGHLDLSGGRIHLPAWSFAWLSGT